MFSKEVLKIVKRLQEARLSLMRKQPFYAVLLLHMQFSLDPMCETVYTDGERIAFCPDFIETLSDEELEFVLMHEVLHAALNHCNRKLDSYDFDDFNTACDIVVNSNILYSFDMDLSKITLTNYGESMHIAPDGKEGYEYTVEEVYRLVQDKHEAEDRKSKKNSSSNDNNKKSKKKEKSDGTAENDSQGKGNPDDTEDEEEQNREEGDGSEDGNEDEAATPARSDGGFDDHTYRGSDDQNEASGQGGDGDGEGEGTDSDSDEDDGDGSADGDSENITNGSDGKSEGEGKAPKTGHNNSYNKVASDDKKSKKKEKSDGTAENDSQGKGNPDDTEDEEEQNREEGDSSEDGNEDEAATPARSDGGFDDHTYWGSDDQDEASGQGGDGDGEGEGTDSDSDEDDGDGSADGDSENITNGSDGKSEGEGKAPKTGHNNSYNKVASDDKYSKDESRDTWLQRMIEATQIAEQISIRQGGNGCGKTPLGAQRIIKELVEPQTDWRTVLDMFVQEEITDYSFNPPDRRFQDSPFLLPDYNEKDESVKDILFMIDTSGSMSDHMITQAYSEIYGAIQQFNGNLQGWLGFFDACVVEPKEFTDEDEFKIIRPEGGGGTSFHCIFEYVKEHIDEINPSCIIILTDGYAPWPDEEAAMDIPVLWLINNEDAQPPWGKVTRVKIDE